MLEHQQLDSIPLNGRNWATLEMFTPGAIDTGGGGQRDIRFAGHGLDDANYTLTASTPPASRNRARRRMRA